MGFTTPRTWNVGEIVTKVMLDQQIRDNMNALFVGTAAGDIDYYATATQKANLAAPAALGLLQNVVGGPPSWLNKGSPYNILRMNSAGNAFEFAPILAYCLVGKNATQTLNASDGMMQWQVDTSDDNGWHDPVTNNQRITPGVAGDYIATAFIHAAGADSELLKVLIKINNSTIVGGIRVTCGYGFENYANLTSRIMTLTNTDYVVVTASNSAVPTVATQTDAYFQLVRVR